MQQLMLIGPGLVFTEGASAGVASRVDEIEEALCALAVWLIALGLLFILWVRSAQGRQWVSYQAAHASAGYRAAQVPTPSPAPPQAVNEQAEDPLFVQVRSYSPGGEITYLVGELLVRDWPDLSGTAARCSPTAGQP